MSDPAQSFSIFSPRWASPAAPKRKLLPFLAEGFLWPPVGWGVRQMCGGVHVPWGSLQLMTDIHGHCRRQPPWPIVPFSSITHFCWLPCSTVTPHLPPLPCQCLWHHHPSKLPALNLCLGVCFCDKSRTTCGHWKPKEAGTGFSPACGGSPVRFTPWFKPSDVELLPPEL